ncbi:chorismate-binding protein [Lutimonas saemankumensis]|uniref:anthranilate synthase component I family protein n=1 Tax=Lutimonas saemankumensis TaxID=483016 RepID=UPI001CD34EE2|nr:chorismate-binding protein [Lutimonas saemankumensis]MCA0932564.1 chorismate-binding protein [Lutimonas saemankumensis]
MKYKLNTNYKKILADTITPVSIYLKIRDTFPNSILLESSDYHGNENSFSYVCCNPIAHISVKDQAVSEFYPDGSSTEISVEEAHMIPGMIHDFSQRFETENQKFKFINNGLFGYIGYDAVKYFEDIEIDKKEGDLDIPDIYYAVYQNIIAINHFKNEAYIFSHSYDQKNNIEEIHQLIGNRNFASYSYRNEQDETSSLSDEEFMEHVELAKKHCFRGDVFQLVLSRRFSQGFQGDEFNVYRALRSVNPSPYLFYFDYGNFKIFGSSPEAQLVVNKGKAEIHPIAGTFKRTGDDEKDLQVAKSLAQDEKENAEHVMLVDLARNDLSRNGEHVQVEKYKEIQFFSHVIHLVSKVVGRKYEDAITFQVVADTFPAGTLSGAPKHKAMQLIEKYEKENRTFYGGAIGFMDFEGNFNHAIIIRSFLSKNHRLHYQAGAGIVSKSSAEDELQEVYNKLGALKSAMQLAENI